MRLSRKPRKPWRMRYDGNEGCQSGVAVLKKGIMLSVDSNQVAAISCPVAVVS